MMQNKLKEVAERNFARVVYYEHASWIESDGYLLRGYEAFMIAALDSLPDAWFEEMDDLNELKSEKMKEFVRRSVAVSHVENTATNDNNKQPSFINTLKDCDHSSTSRSAQWRVHISSWKSGSFQRVDRGRRSRCKAKPSGSDIVVTKLTLQLSRRARNRSWMRLYKP